MHKFFLESSGENSQVGVVFGVWNNEGDIIIIIWSKSPRWGYEWGTLFWESNVIWGDMIRCSPK